MKLAVWARPNGVHPQTAYRWFRQGTMPVPARRLPSGTILVDTPSSPPGGRVVLYARVSAHDQQADLDRQVARMTAWATKHDMAVAEVVCEVSASVNGKRPKLRRLLADPQTTAIVVSTTTGWSASAWSIWRQRWPPKAAGCWWSIPASAPMT
jgi:putative resolvase